MRLVKTNDLIIAPLWKRTIAFAIDIVIVVVLFSLVIWFLNWAFEIPVAYSFFEGHAISIKMTDYVSENLYRLVLIYSLTKLIVVAFYFVGLEGSRWQATIGKKLLKIKVGDWEGKRISFGKAGLRLFGKWISGQILLLGYLMAFFTKKRQALHDFLAGTFVFEN